MSFRYLIQILKAPSELQSPCGESKNAKGLYLFTFLLFWDVSYAVDLGLADLKCDLWQQAGKLQGVFLC